MTLAGNGSAGEPYFPTVHSGGASVVQVETIGRNGVFALWFSSFIAAGALIAVLALCFWIDRLSSRIYVLEYDVSNICAQLINQEIIEVCH